MSICTNISMLYHFGIIFGKFILGFVTGGGRIVAASEMLRPSVNYIQQAEVITRGFKKQFNSVTTRGCQYFVKSIRTVTTQDQSQKAKRDSFEVERAREVGRHELSRYFQVKPKPKCNKGGYQRLDVSTHTSKGRKKRKFICIYDHGIR